MDNNSLAHTKCDYFDTNIGAEEFGHLEIVGSIAYQLAQAAGSVPFTANQFQFTRDIITDLFKDMAAGYCVSHVRCVAFA